MPDHQLLLAAAYFGGMFSIAFTLGWIIPLLTAYRETPREPKRRDLIFGLFDLALILLDVIPIFWIFRAAPEVSSAYAHAREKWKSEKSVRGCFYTSIAAYLLTTIPVYLVTR